MSELDLDQNKQKFGDRARIRKYLRLGKTTKI